MLRYAIVIAIFVVVGAIFVQREYGSGEAGGDAGASAGDATAAAGVLEVGRPAPDFELETREGRVRLSDLVGGAVIVNFWATWCGPCREEMPELQSVHEAHAERGDLVVLAVNVTSADVRRSAEAFIDEFGFTFPVAFDESGDVTRRYGVLGLPASFFVDAEGVLRARTYGPLTSDLLAAGLAAAGVTDE